LLLDVHRASGLWLFAGVMILAATSICMNFFDEAFWPVVSTLSPPRASPLDAPAPAKPGPDLIGFGGALANAESAATVHGTDWKAASESYLPDRNLYVFLLTPSGRVSYRWLGPIKLYVDGRSGALVHIDDVYRDSAGRKLNRALYPLHSGEMIGPFGIAIVFLLGLATIEMCVSGGYIWWKKRRSRRAMERAKRAVRRA
jgi:uncharacterized iron-regulated membrane protein